MRITGWLGDLRDSLTEMKAHGHAGYFFEMSWRTVWADAKLRLGLRLEFRRSVVQAADACDAEDSSSIESYDKCRAAGDRAGMAFWRSVGVYSVVSAMHGTGKIRIIDG